MKKLFTTLILMGVALCTWADPSLTGSLSGTTLTITYVADEGQPNYLTNLNDHALGHLFGEPKDWESVETLVLVGDFANKDLPFISEKFVGKCVGGPGNQNKKIFLDLSACTKMKSKVVKASDGTWNADIDWVTTQHAFMPNGVNETVTSSTTYDVTRTATPYSNTIVTVSRHSTGDINENTFADYNAFIANVTNENPQYDVTYNFDGGTIEYHTQGQSIKYYEWSTWDVPETGWYWVSGDKYTRNLLSIDIVHDSGETVVYTYEKDSQTIEIAENQLDKDGNGNFVIENGYYKYTETTSYTIDNSVFKFKDGSFNNIDKLNGIAFPDHADFNYIPDQLCLGKTGLTRVTFGAYTEWIGAEAFSGCTALTDPVFPATMKVFGGDSFKNCNSFYKVDLSVLPKIQIVDYMAFGSEGATTATSNLAEFILPTSDNTSLKYFANYVIRGTKVKKLDFTHCLGIQNFAHDGLATFGEFSENWTSYWTFYGSSELEEIILPPKLSYVTKDAFNTCPALQTVTFLGNAIYDMQTCPDGGNVITNPLIIDENAFKDLGTLTTVNFCNRITEIRQMAFQKTGLTSVSIPASVQIIGNKAFSECTDMTVVTFDEIDANCAPCKHARTVIEGEHRKQAKDPVTGDPLFDEQGNPVYEQAPLYEQETDEYGNPVYENGEPVYVTDGDGKPVQATDDQGHLLWTVAREGDGNGAFFNCPNITDIYINAVGADIICENKAFDYRVSFGQTDPNGHFATVHYPAGEERKYVNLDHYLTDEIAHTPGLFQAWLQAHYVAATVPSNNGWYEFINSGPSTKNDEPPFGDNDFFLRTYSDPDYARIVPKGIKAYIVKKMEKNGNNYELTLQSLSVIPKQTGVILFGQPNANAQGGGKTLAMSAVEFAPGEGKPLRRDYWDVLPTALTQDQSQTGITEPDAVRLKNYLQPIIANAQIRTPAEEGTYDPDQDEFTETNQLKVDAFEKVNGVVAFRNFALNRFSTTKNLKKKDEFKNLDLDEEDYAAFFRIIPGTYSSGYAYLHLTADEYPVPQGAECVVIKDLDYKKEVDTSGSIKDYALPSTENPNNLWKYATWEHRTKAWGIRGDIFNNVSGGAFEYLGEIEDDIDGVVKLVIPATTDNENDFYTLQGVKVTNPTKGVYIRNGKKVVIK